MWALFSRGIETWCIVLGYFLTAKVLGFPLWYVYVSTIVMIVLYPIYRMKEEPILEKRNKEENTISLNPQDYESYGGKYK